MAPVHPDASGRTRSPTSVIARDLNDLLSVDTSNPLFLETDLTTVKKRGLGISPKPLVINGSGARTRTADKTVNSRLLYQLSYTGIDAPHVEATSWHSRRMANSLSMTFFDLLGINYHRVSSIR